MSWIASNKRLAIDVEAGANLHLSIIENELYGWNVFYTTANRKFHGILGNTRKLHRTVIAGDRENPTLCIESELFQAHLDVRAKNGSGDGFEDNTIFVRHVVNGIACLNNHSPLSLNPIFFSDYDRLKARVEPRFSMPSDKELWELSIPAVATMLEQSAATLGAGVTRREASSKQ